VLTENAVISGLGYPKGLHGMTAVGAYKRRCFEMLGQGLHLSQQLFKGLPWPRAGLER